MLIYVYHMEGLWNTLLISQWWWFGAKPCLTLETPSIVASQTALSMGFPRQEYGRGLPFPSPGGFSDPGIEPVSPVLQADSLPLSHQRSPHFSVHLCKPDLMVFCFCFLIFGYSAALGLGCSTWDL